MKKTTFLLLAIFCALALISCLGLPTRATAQRGCSGITYSSIHLEPCWFRFQVDNSSECYPFLRLLLDVGEFTDWVVAEQDGWTGELISPTELLLTHSSGFVPLGSSSPLDFSVPAETELVLTVLWDYNCDLGEGCVAELPLVACTLPADACISGLVYWECGTLPYSEQATLAGFEISLANETGEQIASTTTDSDGAYLFCDLPPGSYHLRQSNLPEWWSPSVPILGMYALELDESEMAVLNFGNCPECTCESLYLDAISMVWHSRDTCAYTIVVQNIAEDCFDAIDLRLDAGEIAGWMFLEEGWAVDLVDAQHLRLFSTSGSIPVGGHYPLKLNITGSEEVIISMSASEIEGGMMGLCERTFTHTCPLPLATSCCPAGTFPGPELVTNGDFEAGNTGFITGYPYFSPGGQTAIGRYSVLRSNQVYAANNQWTCTDHTAASPTGRMLIIDGNYAPSNIAWRNYVSVQQGDSYSFCTFVNNLIRPSRNLDNPIIQLWINFTQVASINLSETPDNWVSLSAVWTANVNGSVPIDIRVGSAARVGNDFAVDDISFRECSPTPFCSADFTYQLTSPCGQVQFTNTSSPTNGLTYCWDFDGDPQTCESTAANPAWTFPGCGTYAACLTITGPECPAITVCQQLSISDTSPPSATCLTNAIVFLDANCSASITPTDVATNFLDNCQLSAVSVSPNTFSTCGAVTVNVNLTDWCNNTSSISCQVQVVDSTPPNIVCPPVFSTNCNANILPGTTGVATATDNCSSAAQLNFSYTDMVFSQINPITGAQCDNYVERTWAVSDHCENSSTCVQTISVLDNIDPLLTNCPLSMTIPGTLDANGTCTASLSLAAPNLSDNCDPFPTLSNSFNGTTDASGTYPAGSTTVTWTAMDVCGNVASCSHTVTVACNPVDTCGCGNFSDLFLRGPQGAQSQPLVCGGPPLNIGCPAPGQGYTLTGNFECAGMDCPPNANIDWTLAAPDGSPAATGSTQSPWFAFSLASGYFTQAGVYTLTLTGHCGTQSCPCSLQFLVEEGCTDPCPCDLEELQTNVNQGFASALWSTSCRACFSPLALDDCDEVEWLVDDLFGTPVGASAGNQSFCYTFPTAGTYTVYMRVTRLRADGSLCESFTKAQTVQVSCLFRPDCATSIFPNPRFSEGAVAGTWDAGGASSAWEPLVGNPEVVEGETGSYDGWTIQLAGNMDAADVLTQFEAVCITKDTGTLTIQLRLVPWGDPHIPENDGKKWDFKARLFQGDDFDPFDCPEDNCWQLASIDLSPYDTGWVNLEIPYNLQDWNASSLCGGVLVRPAIYLTNPFNNDQGGEAIQARLQMDNFCLAGLLVGTDNNDPARGIRLFPNPTTGEINLRFTSGLPGKGELQLIDLWGRSLHVAPLQPGQVDYHWSVEKLPAGIYFVQISAEGRLRWITKLVKQ